MVLSRRRKPLVIIMMMAIYAAAFLLHDLTHSSAPLLTGHAGLTDTFLSGQNSESTPDGDSRLRPSQTSHHCPFCNGFTGSVTVTPLPPPVEHDRRTALPNIGQGCGTPASSSFARAPPAA